MRLKIRRKKSHQETEKREFKQKKVKKYLEIKNLF